MKAETTDHKMEPMKTYTLDEVKDSLIGKVGEPVRDQYEQDLNLDLLGERIRKARLERGLTQQQLGDMAGLQKSQISRLENHSTEARLETLVKVFTAMKVKLHVSVEMDHEAFEIV